MEYFPPREIVGEGGNIFLCGKMWGRGEYFPPWEIVGKVGIFPFFWELLEYFSLWEVWNYFHPFCGGILPFMGKCESISKGFVGKVGVSDYSSFPS